MPVKIIPCLGHYTDDDPPEAALARMRALDALEARGEWPPSDTTRREWEMLRDAQDEAFARALGLANLDLALARHIKEHGEVGSPVFDWPPATAFARDTGRVSDAQAQKFTDALGFNSIAIGHTRHPFRRWSADDGGRPRWFNAGFACAPRATNEKEFLGQAKRLAQVADRIYPGEFVVFAPLDWSDKWVSLSGRGGYFALLPTGFSIPRQRKKEPANAD